MSEISVNQRKIPTSTHASVSAFHTSVSRSCDCGGQTVNAAPAAGPTIEDIIRPLKFVSLLQSEMEKIMILADMTKRSFLPLTITIMLKMSGFFER